MKLQKINYNYAQKVISFKANEPNMPDHDLQTYRRNSDLIKLLAKYDFINNKSVIYKFKEADKFEREKSEKIRVARAIEEEKERIIVEAEKKRQREEYERNYDETEGMNAEELRLYMKMY